MPFVFFLPRKLLAVQAIAVDPGHGMHAAAASGREEKAQDISNSSSSFLFSLASPLSLPERNPNPKRDAAAVVADLQAKEATPSSPEMPLSSALPPRA